MSNASKVKKSGFCLASLKQDQDKVEKGVLIPFQGGCSLRIARYGSYAMNKMMSNFYKENETLLKSDSEQADTVAQQNLVSAYANHVLVGWEGVIDEDGNEEPYSVEAAEEYLKTDEIFEFVSMHSKKHENFRIKSVKELGEELKN